MCRFAFPFLFVLAFLAAPHAARAEPKGEFFVDQRGERVEFRPAYDGWFGEQRYPKRYVRALLLNGAAMGFELFLYWYDPQSNTVDWQFPDLGSKLSQRSIARFDDNLERTNWLLHPAAGATHYGLTRLSGFGVLPSFGAAAVSSALYEVVFEWREIISLNDLIVTPFGGMAVGEFFFQLGNYLNSEQTRPRTLDEVTGVDEFGRRVGAVALGFPRRMTNYVDEPASPPLVSDDSLGLSSAYAHRFELLTGEDLVTNDTHHSSVITVLGGKAELAAMPGFLRPGHFSTWFGGGNFTRFSARAAFDETLRDLDLQSDAHLFGLFRQDLDAVRHGRRGVAYEIAGLTGIHYVDRWLLGRRDQYALIHLLGPVGRLWIDRGPVQIRLGADVAPDFAAPYSLAYEEYARAFGEEGVKSSLLAHKYYFSWGASAGVSAGISIASFSAGLDARYGRYESIDGQERKQEQVTHDEHLHDEILELSGNLAVEPEGTPLSVRLETAHFGRRSHMAPFTVRRSDERLGVAVGVHF